MRAHKAICQYDDRLIENLADLEIDHIIPESLSKDKLAVLLKRLGKEDLDINSYFNWFPVHRSCNNSKSDILHPDAALHHLLGIAASKVPTVRNEEAKFDRQARANDALAKLARQIEVGALSKEAAIAFLDRSLVPSASKADPTVLGFSINLADATATGPNFGRESMQAELEDSLKILNALTVKTEPAQDNGETLSIRYAVWPLNLDLLPKRFPNAWCLLEVAPFSEVYPGQDASTLVDQAVILKRNELIVDPNSNHPLPYRFCPTYASPDLRRGSHTTEDKTFYYIECRNCDWVETETF